jgi:DNA-directed RNA polymerase beta subunit
MAAKAGALRGEYMDATPFRFNEDNRAIDTFGVMLKKAGYNYMGSEPLYSGLTGTVMHADIYMGIVYYQRLRHMVSDKSQVRATGMSVTLLTMLSTTIVLLCVFVCLSYILFDFPLDNRIYE